VIHVLLYAFGLRVMWVHSFVGVSWNGLSGGWRAVGTLLGPERTGDVVSSDIVLRVSFLGFSLFLHQPAGCPFGVVTVFGVWQGCWGGVPVVV